MMFKAMFFAFLAGPSFAQEDKAVDEALDKFKVEYKSSDAGARAAAVLSLAKTQHARVINKLAGVLMSDVSTVRVTAANGLADAKENRAKAGVALLGALGPNSKDEDVILAIYGALGKLQEETTLPAVHKAFEDKNVTVAKAAIGASGGIRSRHSIDVLINLGKEYEVKKSGKVPGNNTGGVPGTGGNVPGAPGLPGVPGGGGDDPKKKRGKELLPAIVKALQSITKEKWSTFDEWEIWWGRNKGTFKVGK